MEGGVGPGALLPGITGPCVLGEGAQNHPGKQHHSLSCFWLGGNTVVLSEMPVSPFHQKLLINLLKLRQGSFIIFLFPSALQNK